MVSRQLGLNLNKTHFSVFVSDSNRTFEFNENDGASETVCTVQEGTREIRSMKRNEVPEDKSHIDFVVLFDKEDNFSGQIVDPSGIDCIMNSDVDEIKCEAGDGSLTKIYADPDTQKSGLMRAWIQLDLVVTH